MANITAKTSSNIFYKARCTASKHNEMLSSREGAADIMAIDRGRLYRIENSITNPYPEEIRLMSDLYNAPELENHYCKHICPLGVDVPEAFLADLDRITVKALATFRKIDQTKEMLLDISEDGVVSDEERDDMSKVIDSFEELEQVAQSLKIWAKKNL